jgi:hypothetical protein
MDFYCALAEDPDFGFFFFFFFFMVLEIETRASNLSHTPSHFVFLFVFETGFH